MTDELFCPQCRHAARFVDRAWHCATCGRTWPDDVLTPHILLNREEVAALTYLRWQIDQGQLTVGPQEGAPRG